MSQLCCPPISQFIVCHNIKCLAHGACVRKKANVVGSSFVSFYQLLGWKASTWKSCTSHYRNVHTAGVVMTWKMTVPVVYAPQIWCRHHYKAYFMYFQEVFHHGIVTNLVKKCLKLRGWQKRLRRNCLRTPHSLKQRQHLSKNNFQCAKTSQSTIWSMSC